MKILEEHLTRTGGEHLVGSRVTLADIVCFCNLILGYKNVFDAAYRDGFPVVTRYFLGLASRPEFRKILGVVQLCSDVLKPPDSAQDS